MTEANDVFADPGFRAAMLEMEALGLRVTQQPQAGSTPYGVLAGNAGSRWFLLPIRPRAVCRASLALIQPLRPVPRGLRNAFGCALGVGMASGLLRHRIHVSGHNRLAPVFGTGDACNAFLTGTAGVHRKLAVQYMDRSGKVLGYAKVSRTPAVHALLANEAATLEVLRESGFTSAAIPRVLLHEVRSGTAVLATDTVTGARGPRPLRLQAMHLAFLDELATRTPGTQAVSGNALLGAWQAQVRGIAHRLSPAWQVRLAGGLRMLEPQAVLITPRGWAHGDFTPVNCFPQRDRLFVFDWEYAGAAYPADFDLIRFLDAAAHARLQRTADRTAVLLHELIHTLDRNPDQAHARLAAYAYACVLRGALRQPAASNERLHWASEHDDAAMLDALLARSRRGRGEPDSPRSPRAVDAAHARHPSGVA